MIKIAHVSDNHSTFPIIPDEADIIFHSGDLFPNKTRGLKIEPRFQMEWAHYKLDKIINWIGNRPFVFCRGNHDYYDGLCEVLRTKNIEAYDITNSFCRLNIKGQEILTYGIPYINYIAGEWRYELLGQDMANEFRVVNDKFLEIGMPDILVCHAPIYQILDKNEWGEHCGNRVLADYISYVWRDNLPKLLLCGHIHGAHGLAEVFGMKVSNAATTVNLIEY